VRARGYLPARASSTTERPATLMRASHCPAEGSRDASSPSRFFTTDNKADWATRENITFNRCHRIVGAESGRQPAARAHTETLHPGSAGPWLTKGFIVADTKCELASIRTVTCGWRRGLHGPTSSRYWRADEWQEGCRPEGFCTSIRAQLVTRFRTQAETKRRQAPAPHCRPTIVDATRSTLERSLRTHLGDAKFSVGISREPKVGKTSATPSSGTIMATDSSTPTSGVRGQGTPRSPITSRPENDYTEHATMIWHRCGRRYRPEIKARPRKPICRADPSRRNGGIMAGASKAKHYRQEVGPVTDPERLDTTSSMRKRGPREPLCSTENIEGRGHEFSARRSQPQPRWHIPGLLHRRQGDERYTLRVQGSSPTVPHTPTRCRHRRAPPGAG